MSRARGAGVFLDTAPAGVGRMSAVDIVPMAAGIRRADFLRTTRGDYPAGARLAVIGNPPFGYRATPDGAVFFNFIPQGGRKINKLRTGVLLYTRDRGLLHGIE